MANVSRVECGSQDNMTKVRGSWFVVRYEEDGDKLIAVCEDKDGNRWYEIIKIDENVLF